MGRTPKVWATRLAGRPAWDARRGDGRDARQVRAMVAAYNQQDAAAALGMSVHELRNYATEPNEDDQAVARRYFGMVLIEPQDPHDTIAGTTGWRLADPQPTWREPDRRESHLKGAVMGRGQAPPNPPPPIPKVGDRPPWREIADALAGRLRYHSECASHPRAESNPNCPWCKDRDAFDLYLQAGGTVERPGHDGPSVPIHEIP